MDVWPLMDGFHLIWKINGLCVEDGWLLKCFCGFGCLYDEWRYLEEVWMKID